MFRTPLPVRRRLVFTTPRPAKRRRVNTSTAVGKLRLQNRRTTRGPRRTGTLRQQVKSLQSIVKNLAPEQKYLDVALDSTDIPTTGTVVHITPIPQGDGQSARTGNTVNVTTIHVTGFYSRNATNPSVNGQHRVAVVVDKEQVADTAPTAGDIFQTAAEPSFGAPNLLNLERFRILFLSPVKDSMRMVLDSDAVSANAPSQSNLIDFAWSGNIKVSFNGTAGTDMEKNNIYVVFLSNDITGDFDGTARIGYTDV